MAVSTRRRILDHLKLEPHDTDSLAAALQISRVAVRKQLLALQAEGLVEANAERRPVGRPPQIWRLSDQANSEFPESYEHLARTLLVAAQRTGCLPQLIDEITEIEATRYAERIADDAPLRQRLESLTRMRNQDGYMAELTAHGEGGFTVTQRHCPICHAAESEPALCAAEIDLFQELVGASAVVTRTEHAPSGDGCCRFEFRATAKQPHRGPRTKRP